MPGLSIISFPCLHEIRQSGRMDAKLARASHRSRNLQLSAAERHRERHGLGFISRELARGPSAPSVSYSDRMHGDDLERDDEGEVDEVVPARHLSGNGKVETKPRPTGQVEPKETGSLRAEEVALESLAVTKKRWRGPSRRVEVAFIG